MKLSAFSVISVFSCSSFRIQTGANGGNGVLSLLSLFSPVRASGFKQEATEVSGVLSLLSLFSPVRTSGFKQEATEVTECFLRCLCFLVCELQELTGCGDIRPGVVDAEYRKLRSRLGQHVHDSPTTCQRVLHH